MAKGEIGDLLAFFRGGVLVVVLRGTRGTRGGEWRVLFVGFGI